MHYMLSECANTTKLTPLAFFCGDKVLSMETCKQTITF